MVQLQCNTVRYKYKKAGGPTNPKAIRYVKDGVVNESLLMVKTTENLDAATFTELTLNTLTENNIDPLVCLANAMMAQNIDENDEPFKSEYFETLDILIAELQRRFSDNDDLINSIASLDELDVDKMVPLKNLGLKIPSREEASVVKAYLSRNEDIMENTLQVLYRQREAFKDTYELFASVATIGCSTAVCESTFSTLTAINRPQRLSMGHERMAGMEAPDATDKAKARASLTPQSGSGLYVLPSSNFAGLWGSEVRKLGRRLRDKEGDSCSVSYLFQTLSLLRGNAASVVGIFGPSQTSGDIFRT
ncbi:hypothetical protein EVAR_24265_1 [Eumeta japonica]|uniref:HAT C-terminal dimerisation domain-containing protein n=1 Tax=Eumeta variegata TaxID=151549 RepID=A0A4C1VEU7_EUMVA|nr:hypothetical protein EVAR_24265_1 [Eumeta japonica]